MNKVEFKSRLKRIGLGYLDVSEAGGIGVRSIYNWKEVPKWADWWLRYREATYYIERRYG